VNKLSALAYTLPEDAGVVVFEPAVLLHLISYRQLKCLAPEAGGQLFASMDEPKVMRIVEATGPRLTDRRSLFGYHPDRKAEKLEITDRYAHGLHFVGDWHTHAQSVPRPSDTDLESMAETVAQSVYDIPGFLLVIVGRRTFSDGLHVSFHQKKGWEALSVAANVPVLPEADAAIILKSPFS
jgi:integrative and conjugative element protein (TIGR02256 family)